jgi:predicted permease
VKNVFTNWRLYIVALLKLLVIPVVVYLLLKPIMGASMVLGVMVVIMAMPVATIITMLSAQYDKDQTLAASSVFITTLLSVITIPLLAAVLKAG